MNAGFVDLDRLPINGCECQVTSSQELCDGDLQLTPDVEIGAARFPSDSRDASTLLSRACGSVPPPGATGTMIRTALSG